MVNFPALNTPKGVYLQPFKIGAERALA